MREILFRGKRKDTGEWITGNLLFDIKLQQAKICGLSKTPIFKYYGTSEGLNREEKGYHYEDFCFDVDLNTVGQYTGLTDKNGQKIFEGDILKYLSEDNKIVYLRVLFEDCAFLIEDNGIIDCDLLTSYVCLGIEVAGNIDDNPELLGLRGEAV